LFIRSIGDATDIVQKEMYVFTDRGGRSIALRPEATASVVRAYLENYSGRLEPLTKFFYIGPMFRSERPQKGRQRQFHQLGIEAIGSDNPLLDAEVISLAVNFLEKLDISGDDFSLKINSLGCQKDKLAIIEKYKKVVKPYLKSLCDECNARCSKNVLRVFDCKNPQCKEIIKDIEFKNLLCGNCTEHFDSVKAGLDNLKIPYIVDPKIVRGLDYYTKTVFEIIQKNLGAKDAICAGGRYNNLIRDMGGEDTAAIGFAFGIERLVLVIKEGFSKLPPPPGFFIATSNEKLYERAFELMDGLRGDGHSCDMEYEKKSLKAQMRKAQRLNAGFVIILGEDEFARGKVVIRDMDTGNQQEAAYNKDVILSEVKQILKKEKAS
ncbi:MAG: histidine--tRNA ligase, partial [Candidatus Omnitrophica bacterium]|nr:histidine--tRNA ligase [Candidatus Omnitrophota bacterium]